VPAAIKQYRVLVTNLGTLANYTTTTAGTAKDTNTYPTGTTVS
jgi:hypothetical protein